MRRPAGQLLGWQEEMDKGKSSTKPKFWLEHLVNNDKSHSGKIPKAQANELDCGHL